MPIAYAQIAVAVGHLMRTNPRIFDGWTAATEFGDADVPRLRRLQDASPVLKDATLEDVFEVVSKAVAQRRGERSARWAAQVRRAMAMD